MPHCILHLVSFLFILYDHKISFTVIPTTLDPLLFGKNTLHFLLPWLTYIFSLLVHSTYIYQGPTICQAILGTKVHVHQATKQTV